MEDSCKDFIIDKKELRRMMRAKRKTIHESYLASPAHYYQKMFSTALPAIEDLIGPDEKCVAGYVPIQSELDCFFVMSKLKDRHKLALPVVVAPGQPLIFREWDGNPDKLVSGKYGIKVPAETCPEVRPDVVLVPMIGYTKEKYRLGFGYGYYDRTFELLSCLKIGLCYTQQLVDSFPHSEYDIPMDVMVTEDGLL